MKIDNDISTTPIVVSLIVFSYNQEATILQTLQAVVNQKLKVPFEILIGDDGSIDNTRAICEAFKAQYPDLPITLYPKEPNVGLVANYKRLIAVAKGTYVACCAGDDYWNDEYKIQKQLDCLLQDETIGMVYTNFSTLTVTTQVLQDFNAQPLHSPQLEHLLLANPIGALTTCYKTRLIKECIAAGILDRGFLMEDYPTWLYIAENHKIHFLADNTAVWRKNEESASNSKDIIKTLLYKLSIVNVQVFFAKRNDKLQVIHTQLVSRLEAILHIASDEGLEQIANTAFSKLQEISQPSLKSRLFLAGAKSKMIRKAIQLISK